MWQKIHFVILAFALVSCAQFLGKKDSTVEAAKTNETPASVEEEMMRVQQRHAIQGASHFDEIETKTHEGAYFLYGAEHLHLKNYYFDIPVVYNDDVKRWISYFLNKGKQYFIRYSMRAGRYAPMMGKILEEYGLPRDLIFLAMAESGFITSAKSWARAVGPWQFMPYTGKKFGLHIDWFVDERRDPIKATIAACKYLKELYERFESWELAAAAYNAGEGKVGRAIRRYRTENFWKIKKGRYLKRETKNYVPKIMALAIIGKNLESFGFKDIDFHDPLDFEEIKVAPATDLYLLAESLQIDLEELQRLNPEILRWMTPLDASYDLRVPVGTQKEWVNWQGNKDYFKATLFQTYTIKQHGTLRQLASMHKIKDVEVLRKLNNDIDALKRLDKGFVVNLPFREGQNRKDVMYGDLYERPRKSQMRYLRYRQLVSTAKRKGKEITNPSEFYTVQRGDSLWTVAQKKGISIHTLIKSNLDILNRRMIRAGDRLVIR